MLKILTSLLSMHVGALRKAVLFVLEGKECEDDALFSLNFLLQASYDKSKQEELLGKLGDSFKLIESVLGTLNSRNEVNLSIKEHLLTSATDMVECLRTDPFGAFYQPQCDLCKPSFAALSSESSVPCGLILFCPLLLFR